MLRNRSTLLKLGETIIFSINLTIVCMMRWRWRCGCRWQCPQPRVGRLWQFRCTRFVLWAYWNRLVARSHGGGGEGSWNMGSAEAIWGGRRRLICCIGGRCWERWPNPALPPPLCRLHGCCQWEGARVLVGSERGGRKSVHGDGGDRVTGLTPIFWCGMFNALFLHAKEWGGHDVGVLLD